MRMRFSALAFGGLAALAIATQLSAAPVGWRTDGTGRYPDAQPATTWSTEQNVVWAAELPSWSNATPALAGEWVFVCSEPTTLYCLRRSDGGVVWKQDHSSADGTPETHGHNGYSSSTPIVDGDRIYVLFGNGVAAAYGLDGDHIWRRVVASPVHRWGHSASPVLAGGRLVIQIEGSVYGLDPDTGQTRWEQTGRHSFGSLAAAQVGGLDVVVTPYGDFLRAEDGQKLFEQAAHLEYAPPVIDEDRVYFINGDAHAYQMLPGDEGGLELQLLWRASIPKDRYYGSALVHDGLIYAITRRQKLTVLDVSDGSRVYSDTLDLSDGGAATASTRARLGRAAISS